MRTSALLSLTAALALAACNASPSDKLPEDNATEIDQALGNEANANVAVALPAENATNETAKTAPAPGFTDEQQMHDDADASGMTARLPDEAPTGTNETAPVK